MAYFIDLPRFDDDRGGLCVVENFLPFNVKRIYYIFNVKKERGGHRHKKTIQALVSLSGSCEVFVNDGKEENKYLLDEPHKCLIVEPEDWHTMDKFSKNSTLLVMSSELYNSDDYIDDKY